MWNILAPTCRSWPKVAHNDWVDVAVDATVADPDLTANVFAAFGPVQAKATFNELSGDVHAGDVIGSLVFMQDDNQIAQTDIIAAEDVAAPNFFQGIGVSFDRWIRSDSASAHGGRNAGMLLHAGFKRSLACV